MKYFLAIVGGCYLSILLAQSVGNFAAKNHVGVSNEQREAMRELK